MVWPPSPGSTTISAGSSSIAPNLPRSSHAIASPAPAPISTPRSFSSCVSLLARRLRSSLQDQFDDGSTQIIVQIDVVIHLFRKCSGMRLRSNLLHLSLANHAGEPVLGSSPSLSGSALTAGFGLVVLVSPVLNETSTSRSVRLTIHQVSLLPADLHVSGQLQAWLTVRALLQNHDPFGVALAAPCDEPADPSPIPARQQSRRLVVMASLAVARGTEPRCS